MCCQCHQVAVHVLAREVDCSLKVVLALEFQFKALMAQGVVMDEFVVNGNLLMDCTLSTIKNRIIEAPVEIKC